MKWIKRGLLFLTITVLVSCVGIAKNIANNSGKTMLNREEITETKQMMGRETADTQTKAVHDFLQRGEHLISEADSAQLFPDLFDRVHLRGIWRMEKT